MLAVGRMHLKVADSGRHVVFAVEECRLSSGRTGIFPPSLKIRDSLPVKNGVGKDEFSGFDVLLQ